MIATSARKVSLPIRAIGLPLITVTGAAEAISDDIALYRSLGVASHDIAAAYAILAKAERVDGGQIVELLD